MSNVQYPVISSGTEVATFPVLRETHFNCAVNPLLLPLDLTAA